MSGPGLKHPPLSGEILEAAEANISQWVRTEKIKAATAKAKNDLETYIINTREKLEVDEFFQQVSFAGLVMYVAYGQCWWRYTSAPGWRYDELTS